MRTKEQLRAAHGTPREFSDAVWRACDELWCTTSEAQAAIAKYSAEYTAAPDSLGEPPTVAGGERTER